MPSQCTTTTFRPRSTCLATMAARRPRRWPRPSSTRTCPSATFGSRLGKDLTHFRMTMIKKTTKNKGWFGYGGNEALMHSRQNCKLVQPLWKTVWRLLKKKESRITIWRNNSTSRYLAKENETLTTDKCTPRFTVALFTRAKIWKQLKCPSVDEW